MRTRDYGSMKTSYIRRVLGALSVVDAVILHVKILCLLNDGLRPWFMGGGWVLRRLFNGIWQNLRWNISFLAVWWQVNLHLLFELLSWRFGRKLVIWSHHWRGNCQQLGLWSCLLLLFPSHHLIEFVFILLPENSCSLLPFGNEIIGSCQIVEPVLFNI